MQTIVLIFSCLSLLNVHKVLIYAYQTMYSDLSTDCITVTNKTWYIVQVFFHSYYAMGCIGMKVKEILQLCHPE